MIWYSGRKWGCIMSMIKVEVFITYLDGKEYIVHSFLTDTEAQGYIFGVRETAHYMGPHKLTILKDGKGV